MYISPVDVGSYTYNFDIASTSFAYRTFSLAAGTSYNLDFDWKCVGENGYDFLRVFLCYDSYVPSESSFPTGNRRFRDSIPTGWQALSGVLQTSTATWQHASYTFTVPDDGNYKLVFMWRNDGSDGTNPPAAVDNVQLIVHVPTPTYTVTLASANATMGTVSPAGASTVNENDSFTATATANTGYHFTAWKEGTTQVSTSAAYTFTVTRDISLTAHFAPNSYTLTATSANNTMGTVSGGGSYDYNSTATLTATANTGYHFVQWQDGNTQNPRTVTVTGDATYTATFEANATPVQQYTITVGSNDETMGTVSGGGTYDEGTVITLTATAASGHRFVQWQDGNTQNPRTVTVTEDATYTATFEQEVGIEEAINEAISLYPNPTTTTAIVSGIMGESTITLVDMAGRECGRWHTTESSLTMHLGSLKSGAYFVRIASEQTTTVLKLIVK